MDLCQICKIQTVNKCANCHQVYYCCIEHQKRDWKLHKSNCFPFKIEQCENLGRYLITTRAIKPFEVVLKETPLIRGPSQFTTPVCLSCLNELNTDEYIKCEKCGWPLCSIDCSNNDEHIAECELSAMRNDEKINIQEFTTTHPLYQCISTLRCLYTKHNDKNKWNKLITLESLENRRKGSVQWKLDLENVAKFIPKFFNAIQFEEEEIMKMIGVLQINGHEVPTSEPPHVAIYYNASFLEHSCTPNLAKSFTRDGKIILFAPFTIKKETHLSICYTDPIWGTANRQQHLTETKLFKCNCARCEDNTEFGTYYSGMRCESEICGGILLPNDFRMIDSNWQCNVCHSLGNKNLINNILEKASRDIIELDENITNFFKFIRHYQKKVAPTHFIICEAMIKVIQLIGKERNDLLLIPNEMLQIKIEYSQQMIELYEKLAPCEVRLLGILCFELHSALAEDARRNSLKSGVSPQDILQNSLIFVEKCIKYLQNESEIFIEGQILKQARINRDALKLVIDVNI